MGIRGGEFMEGGGRSVCNWMKTSLQKKKKGISVIGEKPDICCCWTVLSSSFFFLRMML